MAAPAEVELVEWERREPVAGSPLWGRALADDLAARQAVDLAAGGVLEVVELRHGLRVTATSFVGRVRFGDLTITVRPKIAALPLTRLLRYAYRLRDLTLMDKVDYAAQRLGFHDLLIAQLIAEAEELIARGLHRRYRRVGERLPVIRGRVDFAAIARSGGIHEAALPCIHHPRLEDCLVNQALLAGLRLSATLASGPDLRLHARRTAARLTDTVSTIALDPPVLRRLRHERDRLTRAYEPALTLIELLATARGATLDGASDVPLPGFFFDMNRFFQALLSRFLGEHLVDCTVRDEVALRGVLAYVEGYNPQRRVAPRPRPDFAIASGGKPVALLDAKYRDLWELPLPREMLYQLALYAVTQGPQGSAAILYPTLNPMAREARVAVHEPSTGGKMAEVILRPVNLLRLEAIISAPNTSLAATDGERLARELVFGTHTQRNAPGVSTQPPLAV